MLMVNNMSSPALLRRLLSGILRSAESDISNTICYYANRTITTTSGPSSRRWISGILRSTYRGSAADRKITTTSSGSTPVPWLVIRPHNDSEGKWLFRFYCCAKGKIYSFFLDKRIGGYGANIISREMVGSSHGWIALYDSVSGDFSLLDPITYRNIELPPLGSMGRAQSLIHDEREGKAFIIYGSGRRLAFCWPGRSHEWTLFGGDEKPYERLVYSTTHRRLLCITSELKLEAWNVDRELPSLDWAIRLESPDLDRPGLTRLIYLVCAEESGGELFVVVRFVNPDRGNIQGSELPTVDFEVYKIDRKGKGGVMMKMKDSLEGLTIFVGNNHPVAMKCGGGVGVEPNSIYFTYDNRHLYEYMRIDRGIFDYQKGFVRPLSIYHAAYRPIWFTPNLDI